MDVKTMLWSKAPLVGLLVALTGCQVLDTEDGENAAGRGAKAHDPYTGTTAIRLGLQWFGDCAILPNGSAVKKGEVAIPYPDDCPTIVSFSPSDFRSPPTGTFRLLTNTTYFLNQLTFMDMAVERHLDYAHPEEALEWMKSETVFAGLDWTGAGRYVDEWRAIGPGFWTKEVYFGNAAWMRQKEDTFQIEVLDSSGIVRSSQVYSRKDFLSQGHTAGHSRFSWQAEGLHAPRFPGDPELPRFDEFPPSYRSTARMEVVGSTNPFKTFEVGALTGEGAIRVTWSQLPARPFYLPVQFVKPDELAPTCYGGEAFDKPVPCGFGLNPTLSLQTPANGKGYYEPGETVAMQLALKDANGNLLHPLDSLPSYNSFYSGADEQNGLLYYFDQHYGNLREADLAPQYAMAGPLQDLATLGDAEGTDAFAFPPERWGAEYVPPVGDSPGGFPSAFDARWSTQLRVGLPENARPGTYVALLKSNRMFLGERMSKLNAVTFQVGQEKDTKYPGRVGNCQICHRGVSSLDNLRHGLSVDHIEACNTCHATPNRYWKGLVHRIHNLSTNYPTDKRDCTVCHLTEESTQKATVEVCSSCHVSVHGGQYFDREFTTTGSASRYTSCAQSCHDGTSPTPHIVPAN